jgi:tetratricopeptide (TPR) repeat protein
LALFYIQLKEYQKAIDLLRQRTHGTETNWLLANCYWPLGDTASYNRVLKYQLQKISNGEFVPPTIVGHIYLAAGKKEEACKWFRKQVESRDGGLFWLIITTLDPRIDAIRDYPAYKELIKEIPL